MNDIAVSLDTVWMLLAAMLVFFMQPGFALCEAGFTRSKNTANILMKNFVDFMFGSLLFWFVGFGFMFGSDGAGFIGMPNWGDLSFYKSDLPVEGFLIFETVFCATSATIVSGTMAERTKFSMYLVYSAIISLFIYPIEGHWTWGGGWLSDLGFHDFAGSAIVHSVGGVLALIGAIALGPRIGKYTADGKSRAIPGHNLTMAALGVFILWMGWFGFNPGSQLAASGAVNRTAISHVFLTTNLAAAAGGVATMFVTWWKYGKPSLSLTLNGILAGLVGRFQCPWCLRYPGHAPDGPAGNGRWRLLRGWLALLRRPVSGYSGHRPLGGFDRFPALLRHQEVPWPASRQTGRGRRPGYL